MALHCQPINTQQWHSTSTASQQCLVPRGLCRTAISLRRSQLLSPIHRCERSADAACCVHKAIFASAAQQETTRGLLVEKRCVECKRVFELRHYSTCRSQPDGRWIRCRGCEADARLAAKPARKLSIDGYPPTSENMTCKDCNDTLPASFFSLNPSMKRGRISTCRSCKAKSDARRLQNQPDQLPTEKQCGRCGKTLPTACFNFNRLNEDGLFSWCRPCRRLYDIEWKRKFSTAARALLVAANTCSVCGKDKPAAEFSFSRSSRHRLSNQCKLCKNERQRRRYHAGKARENSG